VGNELRGLVHRQQAVVDKNAALFSNPDRAEMRSTNLVWPPLLRKLDRIDPSYRT
jgi:hypothetical protein